MHTYIYITTVFYSLPYREKKLKKNIFFVNKIYFYVKNKII